ncbi:proline-rich transmembrane protein 1-like [Salarias fasciatus]|uniref:proline-rich transmembrane protein 1-like n=1 Tax=Salarias fasciatus TaxID=181472 RepID=UPI001176A2BD|nr:proline-rich transmembrane protein 1-like [Salarias fasciatus]
MDPEKTPIAYSEEKSAMGHPSMGQAPAPPPYQDHPQAQPGLGSPQGYCYQQYVGGYGQQAPYVVGQQYQAHPGAVTIQPTVYVTASPLANPVNDYLCYSIFTMICCCMPLGIAALIYSLSARDANFSGNLAVAERSSRTARMLNHIGLGIGLGVIILSIVYIVVVAGVIASHN